MKKKLRKEMKGKEKNRKGREWKKEVGGGEKRREEKRRDEKRGEA